MDHNVTTKVITILFDISVIHFPFDLMKEYFYLQRTDHSKTYRSVCRQPRYDGIDKNTVRTIRLAIISLSTFKASVILY